MKKDIKKNRKHSEKEKNILCNPTVKKAYKNNYENLALSNASYDKDIASVNLMTENICKS